MGQIAGHNRYVIQTREDEACDPTWFEGQEGGRPVIGRYLVLERMGFGSLVVHCLDCVDVRWLHKLADKELKETSLWSKQISIDVLLISVGQSEVVDVYNVTYTEVSALETHVVEEAIACRAVN